METLIYFLLWAALFLVMMRFGCGAHLFGHGHKGHGTDTGTANRPAAPEKAVAPVIAEVLPADKARGDPRTERSA